MLEPDEIERNMARQTIEVAPLAYMRGRTLSNAFVILDEAQNTTMEQMFMLLTRIGPHSKCVVTGDVTQIDLPANKRSGLVEALQALKNVSGLSFIYFTERDVVRHELVRSIINAYQIHRSGERAVRNKSCSIFETQSLGSVAWLRVKPAAVARLTSYCASSNMRLTQSI